MAIDPATAKAAATLAAKAVTDSKTRTTVMLLILAPVVGLLLLFAMLLQLLIMPFALLGSAFTETEFDLVNDLRADAGFTQLLGEDDGDYLESCGQSYEDVVLSGGRIEVIYYNQLDSRWGNLPYGTAGTIGQAGCGPAALAMIVSSLTGISHNPVEMAEWAVAHGHCCEGNGSYHSIIPEGAKAFGLKAESAGEGDYERVAAALSDGKLVCVIMGKGHFTNSGHFIVLRGITADGNILVADPASMTRSEQEWDFNIIASEAHKGAGAGGPFWIVSTWG